MILHINSINFNPIYLINHKIRERYCFQILSNSNLPFGIINQAEFRESANSTDIRGIIFSRKTIVFSVKRRRDIQPIDFMVNLQ